MQQPCFAKINQVRVDSLSFRRAFLEGYLLPHEYRACYGFAACVALTVVMGLLLSREHQGWVGHLLWTGMLVVGFTFIPAAKWFGTYEVGGGGGEGRSGRMATKESFECTNV